jgi:hypothetical protein
MRIRAIRASSHHLSSADAAADVNESVGPAAVCRGRKTPRRVTESSARVGLIGFGHVGRALAWLLQAKWGPLEALLGIAALRDHPAGGGVVPARRLR